MKKLKQSTNTVPRVSLAFCILMDLIGYATYAIPFFGEFADLAWAPVSAMIFFKTFGGWKGALGGAFNFIEELMPGLDFIPTFTLTYIMKYGIKGLNNKKVFQQV